MRSLYLGNVGVFVLLVNTFLSPAIARTTDYYKAEQRRNTTAAAKAERELAQILHRRQTDPSDLSWVTRWAAIGDSFSVSQRFNIRSDREI